MLPHFAPPYPDTSAELHYNHLTTPPTDILPESDAAPRLGAVFSGTVLIPHLEPSDANPQHVYKLSTDTNNMPYGYVYKH